MTVEIFEALDFGDDVLLVRGTVEGVPVEARGWMSAMTNHFEADEYDGDGHLIDGAEPRQMTSAERKTYCETLLREACDEIEADKPEPIDLNAKEL